MTTDEYNHSFTKLLSESDRGQLEAAVRELAEQVTRIRQEPKSMALFYAQKAIDESKSPRSSKLGIEP